MMAQRSLHWHGRAAASGCSAPADHGRGQNRAFNGMTTAHSGKPNWVRAPRQGQIEPVSSIAFIAPMTPGSPPKSSVRSANNARSSKASPRGLLASARNAAAHTRCASTTGSRIHSTMAARKATWRSRTKSHATALAIAFVRWRVAPSLEVLTPLWTSRSVTASRLRGRIEVIIDAARALGHIDRDRANPARWKGHLDKLLPKPKKLAARGHHRALVYADIPALMTQLNAIDSVASRALMLVILTACRTGEVLGAQWDEMIPFEDKVWRIPASRMKMAKPHDVPLSDAALAILRAQHEARGDNPHVFPGRPMRGLSNMVLAMVLRRLKVDVTVHGFRSSFRDWAADTGVAFEVAEAALAHSVGSAVTAAYLRTSMTARRAPIMQAWADHVCGSGASNVVPMRTARG